MKTWKIPVIWESWGVMFVEAETLDEAKIKARLVEPLPAGSYIEDSMQIDEESIIMEMNDKY